MQVEHARDMRLRYFTGCNSSSSQRLHHDVGVGEKSATDAKFISAKAIERNCTARVLDYFAAAEAEKARHGLVG